MDEQNNLDSSKTRKFSPGRFKSRFGNKQSIVFVLLFAAIGAFLLFQIFAAGNFVAQEAETGTVNSPAIVVNDTSASGGKAIQFNSPPPPSTYRDTIMADTPLAYWRFSTTSSETGAHSGSLRGSPAPLLGQPGPFTGSQSARFDGVLRDNATTGGFLANSLARLSASTWSNGFSLEAWAKTTTTGPEQHVMTFSLADGTARPGILFDDPSDVWKFRDGNVSLSMNGTTTINAWHYLVASVDGSGNGKLYYDGNEVKSWTSTVKPTTTADGLFTVGADYDNHNCPCPHVDTPFNGWIAEVAVYNKPLTAARIQAHYVAR